MAPEEISKLSDFELRKKIAGRLGIHYVGDGRCIKSHGDYFDLPDYCNNWNDLMPLVVEHDIYHAPPYSKGGKYQATQWVKDSEDSWLEVSNIRLERAYAECLLQVLIAKGE